ncbi:NADPH dehydrogenase NamA [Alkalicella caledoniensis]|uniref:NADPH dehydrogenase NamA n=1 Tax=Alkalicella caledoniensis TaxID=2731377 RepID=A0A7G9W8U5_ALKCA|nr:NADPH dehydrogenase NamA [Alkalicella caledoniensis]QNO15107.1 NADPH dehydrogenase NamA [Alkalicella caledoniensis]
MTKLFTPFSIKGVTLKNRVGMSPMCTYSAYEEDGKVTSWHKVHYGARALGQVALVMLEATAVSTQGRISPQDLGIWSDEQIPGLSELVDVIHANGSIAGIQIGHAGRKADLKEPIIAPSPIPFNDNFQVPQEMTIKQIEETIQRFKDGVQRAKKAGFDIIELHGAHGYLISEFLSPITNKRNDEYGGSKEKRFLFLEKIVKEVKDIWSGPLFIRLSIEEYQDDGNHPEDMLYYVKKLKEQGVDFIDCSSGAITPVPPPTFPGYQVRFSDFIKNNGDIPTSTVGLITSPVQAEEILNNNRADIVFLGRELLRNPNWPIYAAKELKADIQIPHQYQRGWL